MPAAPRRTAPLLFCTLLLALPPGEGAPQESAPLVETQRVTAFDLLVELTRPGKPEKPVDPPEDLAPEELTVLWDGTALPLVGLAAGRADPEPWRIVVYVDRVLSSSHTVRWAAMELAERADKLTALGEVEIVVAEPEPRRALAPSRDSALLDDTLSGIFLEPAGGAEPVRRREQFLVDHPGASGGRAPAAATRRAAAEERLLVSRQTDRLLGCLAESEPPTSRRAVLLVGDGWDLVPERFYGGGARAVRPPGLDREARELAETLAAYGWIAAPLAPPPPPVGARGFANLGGWLDRNRRPKKADALTELGRSLRAQGKLDDAASAYGQAIYHYYDHPKTARRQAAALVGLGETLDLLGRRDEARAAFRAATVFDPALEKRFPFSAARLLEPRAPLERLAELTAGSLVTDTGGLEALLLSLENRLRLTAQLSGEPDGALHGIEVRSSRPGFEYRFAPVARWGTAPELVRLRLRRLLDGELASGELELVASPSLDVPVPGRRLEVDLQLARAPGPAPGPPAAHLVSWASAGPETAIRYHLRAERMALGETARKVAIELPDGHDRLAFLAEDAGGGGWGGAGAELPKD